MEKSLTRKIIELWLPLIFGAFIGLTVPKLIESIFTMQRRGDVYAPRTLLAIILITLAASVLIQVAIHIYRRKSRVEK
jgi:hypothetical protein